MRSWPRRKSKGPSFHNSGDHPVDTHRSQPPGIHRADGTLASRGTPSPAHMSPREILVDNADLLFRPLKRSALENGYVATVQAIIRYGMTFYESPNPFHGAKLRYPATAAPRQSTEPLSSEQKNRIFRAGVESGAAGRGPAAAAGRPY